MIALLTHAIVAGDDTREEAAAVRDLYRADWPLLTPLDVERADREHPGDISATWAAVEQVEPRPTRRASFATFV